MRRIYEAEGRVGGGMKDGGAIIKDLYIGGELVDRVKRWGGEG